MPDELSGEKKPHLDSFMKSENANEIIFLPMNFHEQLFWRVFLTIKNCFNVKGFVHLNLQDQKIIFFISTFTII